MLRFYYVILISLPFIIYYLFMAEYYVKNRERYDEKQCYDLAQRLIKRFKKNARIRTVRIIFQKKADILCIPIIRENMMH